MAGSPALLPHTRAPPRDPRWRAVCIPPPILRPGPPEPSRRTDSGRSRRADAPIVVDSAPKDDAIPGASDRETGEVGAVTAAVGAAAAALVWLGAVLGISFLETPLKFRAEGVSVEIGLAIGKIVFRALNLVEIVFAVVVAALVLARVPSGERSILLIAAVVVLAIQILAVRPLLRRRSDRVLRDGDSGERSTLHLVYVGLELVKVVLLAAGALTSLASVG